MTHENIEELNIQLTSDDSKERYSANSIRQIDTGTSGLIDIHKNPKRTVYKSCIVYHDNVEYKLRSSYEKKVYDLLVEGQFNFTYEKLRIKYKELDNKSRVHIVDFYLPEDNLILEVKPARRIDDEVLYKEYAGEEFKFDSEKVVILKQADIIAVIE